MQTHNRGHYQKTRLNVSCDGMPLGKSRNERKNSSLDCA